MISMSGRIQHILAPRRRHETLEDGTSILQWLRMDPYLLQCSCSDQDYVQHWPWQAFFIRPIIVYRQTSAKYTLYKYRHSRSCVVLSQRTQFDFYYTAYLMRTSQTCSISAPELMPKAKRDTFSAEITVYGLSSRRHTCCAVRNVCLSSGPDFPAV